MLYSSHPCLLVNFLIPLLDITYTSDVFFFFSDLKSSGDAKILESLGNDMLSCLIHYSGYFLMARKDELLFYPDRFVACCSREINLFFAVWFIFWIILRQAFQFLPPLPHSLRFEWTGAFIQNWAKRKQKTSYSSRYDLSSQIVLSGYRLKLRFIANLNSHITILFLFDFHFGHFH